MQNFGLEALYWIFDKMRGTELMNSMQMQIQDAGGLDLVEKLQYKED